MKRIAVLIILIAVLCSSVALRATSTNSPLLTKPSNMGTEFYFSFLPLYEESGTNMLILYITPTADGNASVEISAKGFHKDIKLFKNVVTAVQIEPKNGQVFTKPNNGSAPAEQVYLKSAVHIQSDVPVTVNAATRFTYTSDTYSVLAVEALGRNYVVASMPDDNSQIPVAFSAPSEAVIVAAHDNTDISFTVGGNAQMKTVGGKLSGEVIHVSLNKGDVWCVANSSSIKMGDLTGSLISATRPVAVIAGSQCAKVPSDKQYCDFLAEQLTPIEQWGKHYLIPRYEYRTYGFYARVFAGSPGCVVQFDGTALPAFSTVGGEQGKGWIEQRVSANNSVTCALSTSPFALSVYNPGEADDNVSTDPFQMSVIPWEQFSTSYVFSTPGVSGGFNFTRNYLGVVFPLDSNGNMPDDLQFGVVNNGEIVWQSLASKFGTTLGSDAIYKVTMPNGKRYAYKQCILKTNGAYALQCSQPIMAYLYGGADYDSYGHPVGALSLDQTKLSDNEKPRSQIQPTSGGFDIVTTDYPASAQIRSNLAKIAISTASQNIGLRNTEITNTDIDHLAWTAGVIDPTLPAYAEIFIADRAGNDTSIILNYSPTNAPKIPSISNLNKVDYCEGDSVTLQATASVGASLLWTTGDTGRIITLRNMVKGMLNIGVRATYPPDTTKYQSALVQLSVHERPQKPVISQLGKNFAVSSFDGICEWYLNGKLVDSVSSNTITTNLDNLNTVAVRAVSPFGCSTMSDTLILKPADVQQELIAQGVQLLSNPTNSTARLVYGDNKPLRLDLFALNGSRVLHLEKSDLAEHSAELSVKDLAPGAYTLVIYYAEESYALKLLRTP